MIINEKTIAEFSRLLFGRMAGLYGGDCTLNELRVMNAVYVFSFDRGSCTPTLLSKTTGIPKSTVSRSLASLIEKGWLSESQDTHDRRRRNIRLSEKTAAERPAQWQETMNWLADLSEPCPSMDCPSRFVVRNIDVRPAAIGEVRGISQF